ncbi:TetR/AcrR family transcriptional regulator [Carboxydocella sp. ULO1]|uniref:TetR/AcrR family transcriptional regulator n=1 Tax=Carboxydocella sp. ULO1 TaxID=1926599 RepID=UPI0009AE91DF|nr:TetR family transcriptional regulator [Carboxydocella sp. ULO1]GAW29480.1 TetR family transcriptional regulator [Carboxydocella sp. ULO1]
MKTRELQIIQASLKIIASRGIKKFTTAELANEVGVSEAAIFKYFRSKNEILSAAVAYIQQTLLTEANKIASEKTEPMLKLKKLLEFHLTLIENNFAIPELIFSEQLYMEDDRLRKRVAETIESYLEILKNILQQIQDSRSKPSEIDLDMLATAFLGVIQVNLLRKSLNQKDFSLQEEYEKIWGFFKKII